jgi:serine/threonine protein kinase
MKAIKSKLWYLKNDIIFYKDFGFSEKVNFTQLLSKAGTPGYIPPELF